MDTTPVRVDAFRPQLDPEALALLGERLAAARLPPPDDPVGGDWVRGTPATWLAELVEDWRAQNPAAFQSRLDRLTHVRAAVDGVRVHALHQEGRGPAPLPLLLTHGWPGSFCEYLEVLPLLTDPGAHGGDPADAFSVVVPSLPGYGFSGPPPPGGLSAGPMAERWRRLMVDGLGYPRFVAHGSDLGAGITARLARDHADVVAGIHLGTPSLPAPPRPWSEEEEAYFAESAAWTGAEGGYAHEHSTKPATIGAALLDSPVGLAAWIGEKVVAWSDTGADGRPTFPRDLLLDTLTLYWATGTVATSLLPYWAYRQAPADVLRAGEGGPTPVALSNFGGEREPFPKPPRQLAARYFALSYWADHERGGHFPAVSTPELLAETLRGVFRPLR